jgi:hypothetical protein
MSHLRDLGVGNGSCAVYRCLLRCTVSLEAALTCWTIQEEAVHISLIEFLIWNHKKAGQRLEPFRIPRLLLVARHRNQTIWIADAIIDVVDGSVDENENVVSDHFVELADLEDLLASGNATVVCSLLLVKLEGPSMSQLLLRDEGRGEVRMECHCGIVVVLKLITIRNEIFHRFLSTIAMIVTVRVELLCSIMSSSQPRTRFFLTAAFGGFAARSLNS